MVRKGSLVRYTGTNPGLRPGGLYGVHDVTDGKAWLWTRSPDGFSKKRVPVSELEIVVE